MERIKGLVKEPGKAPEEREIENTLKAFQTIVGGYIEGLRIYDDLCCYINDEGKLKNLDPNFVIPMAAGYDIICGPAVFFRVGLEGNETSLTLTDALKIKYFLKGCDIRSLTVNGGHQETPDALS